MRRETARDCREQEQRTPPPRPGHQPRRYREEICLRGSIVVKEQRENNSYQICQRVGGKRRDGGKTVWLGQSEILREGEEK